MRAQWLSLAVSAVLLATKCPTTTAQRYAVFPREAAASTKDAAAASTTHSTTSSSSESTPNSTLDGTSSTSGTPAKAFSTAASSSAAAITATPIAKGSLNVNGTTTPKIEGLPLHPSITPALAVAGPILILTGTLYTLIGIKTKWLHIFLSTAYIFALAITVLIIFVMHTPVSDAAQGGYFVAACVTGLIAGGGSLLFKDIAEGISCFLGGFCLSMWVLILKPGGTISNTTGKIIFISCLTVAAPALYISRHTRPYGLIGSTSFAGATAIVLGIDCFSRAGLKEFWLYIWNLNNAIFPAHYDGPYPITRGIQVETGAIIIFCGIGILSQIKVWKIIRKRKEEKASEQRRRDEERDMADEEHGRRVEDDIKRERGSWEAAYNSGERRKPEHVDSGIGTDEPSLRRASLSIVGTSDVRGSDCGGIELQEMDDSSHAPKESGRLIIHVLQDEEISPPLSVTGQHLARPKSESRESSIHESKHGASNPSSTEASFGNAAALRSIDPNLTLKPKTTRLPFKVPNPAPGSEDGHSSVAASAASEHMTDRWVKRLSGSSSIVRKLSKRSRRSFIAVSTSDEALMVPDEDDRASSIAATVDGVSENDDMEEEAVSVRDRKSSFEILRKQDSMQALMQGTSPIVGLAKDADKSPVQSANRIASGSDRAERPHHVNALIDTQPESVPLPDSEISSTTDVRSIIEEPNMESNPNFAAESDASEQSLRIKRFSTNLPEGASRVVTAYRTNEWAKHLDRADLPEIDELKVRKSRTSDSSQPTERVAPVDIRALQQTPLNAEPAPILTIKTHSLGDRPAAYFQSKNPFHKQQDKQRHNSAAHQLTRDKATERTPSQTYPANSMDRSPSQTSLSSTNSRKEQYRPPLPKFRSSQSSVPSTRGIRSNSSPLLNSPLAESPIEEGVEASFPTRFAPSSTHLMSQRNIMLRNRPSSTSLLRTNWSNATLDQHPALRALDEDEEDISLSQRKSLLQRNPHSIPQRSSQRSSSNPTSGAATPIYSHIHHPSPTPQSPSVSAHPSLSSQDTTISTWRAGLQPSTTTHDRDLEIASRRATLLHQKQQEQHNEQEQKLRKSFTQNVMDRGMRQSSMIELHQQQMRKMQAVANMSLG